MRTPTRKGLKNIKKRLRDVTRLLEEVSKNDDALQQRMAELNSQRRLLEAKLAQAAQQEINAERR
jgi:prefoldin subunit 5